MDREEAPRPCAPLTRRDKNRVCPCGPASRHSQPSAIVENTNTAKPRDLPQNARPALLKFVKVTKNQEVSGKGVAETPSGATMTDAPGAWTASWSTKGAREKPRKSK